MSPTTRTFLDEKRIYVSFGILLLTITIAVMVGRTMAQIDQLIPIISEVQNLKLDVIALKTDINNIKNKLQMYDIEIKNP